MGRGAVQPFARMKPRLVKHPIIVDPHWHPWEVHVPVGPTSSVYYTFPTWAAAMEFLCLWLKGLRRDG